MDRDVDETMSDDELIERLQAAMTAASDGADERHGAPTADAQDLDRRLRIGSARRMQYVGAIAAGLILLAGIGGFLLGTNTGGAGDGDRNRSGALSADADRAPANGGADLAAERSASEDGAGSLEVDPVAPNASGTPSATSVPEVATEPSSDTRTSGAALPLFTRTLDDGTVLDVRAHDADAVADPSTSCSVVGSLYVGVRAPDAVGQVRTPRFGTVPPNALAVQVAVVGVDEGAPRWVLVAQAPEGVERVRATFPGGGVDEASTKSGIAVLSTPSDPALGPDPSAGEPATDELVVEGFTADTTSPAARWTGTRRHAASGVTPTC